ncbi:Ribosomal large subunit pseudouridine synthase C [Peptoniphilus harei]|uniref:RluA family pseudouridine synthase n=1 Tax=Peptoniphilus harei TaxID=54005 RepID=UPI000F72024E|nr:RluA family pseudouridine synthase [Peptoniphilus harei]MDU5418046.1 RluA family pseudouridine synthase [Peptoniphilus harei]QQE46973.1 RluA family pseudouridine synthase [Peptoniphilus harei]VEJ34804.1 Ribosomal large subunit pseudouridine synthase C [Peptoniphilus harei]
MRKIIINKNDEGRRLDRFLKIYFEKAPLSFIYKNLRKKNIKVNGKKAKPEDILNDGDEIKLFLAEDTIEKFKKDIRKSKNSKLPDILYEDDEIILVKKPINMLTHNDSKGYQDNALDRMVDYLIAKGDYNPRLEKSFRPAFVNRLDRNTSGILIGAKNLKSLQDLNKAIKNREIKKLYVTLVAGEVTKDFDVDINLKKTGNNVMKKTSRDEGKRALTKFRVLKSNKDYSLLSVNLITGRTHQIRASLKEEGLAIVGDRKYGDPRTNKAFRERGLDSQFLHNYAIVFESDDFKNLRGKSFVYLPDGKMKTIAEDIFKINLGDLLNEENNF